jgi:outer membrane biosynthesis protein TonB
VQRTGGRRQVASLIRTVPPVNLKKARDAGIEGDVVLKLVIAADGHVESAEPTSGNPILAAATQAVLRWSTNRRY